MGLFVFEEYFYEYTKDSLQELRSASKSFVSALTGIAIEKGFIKTKNETVLSYFPEYNFKNNSETKKRITIENLLTNQSGLDCDLSNPKSEGNETTMSNTGDWVKFTLDLPMIDTPGGKGMYCSGNPITLGRIIEKTTKQPLPEFARKNLFSPLGRVLKRLYDQTYCSGFSLIIFSKILFNFVASVNLSPTGKFSRGVRKCIS